VIQDSIARGSMSEKKLHSLEASYFASSMVLDYLAVFLIVTFLLKRAKYWRNKAIPRAQ
jgi:hypothetical protein